MSLSRGVMCQIMCQIITFKRHQTFLHHPAPREKEHLAFPMPSSSAFVHITLNGVGGGGKVERGKLRPNCMCKSPMVCVSLSRSPGCVPVQTLPLLTAGLPSGLCLLQHRARSKERRGKRRQPQKNPSGHAEETQVSVSYSSCTSLLSRPPCPIK